MIIMQIGDRIRKLRLSIGISQEELANELNITKQAVYRYEKNLITNIPMDKIKAMADIFYVTPAMIMSWEDVKFSSTECYNRLEILENSGFYNIDRILKITKMNETYYSEYKKSYIADADNFILALSSELNLPYNFIIGEAYETTIPFTEWQHDKREDWINANDAGKRILECKYGKPTFKKKTSANEAIGDPAFSKDKQALIDWAKTVPEDKAPAVLQALQTILEVMK